MVKRLRGKGHDCKHDTSSSSESLYKIRVESSACPLLSTAVHVHFHYRPLASIVHRLLMSI